MVKIQKREYGISGITYYQYRLHIPNKIFDLLRWDDTNEIELIIKDGNLICKNITKSGINHS